MSRGVPVNTALPPEKQMVSPEPEVLIIDRNEEDQYLMFACDGIWDVFPQPAELVAEMDRLLVGAVCAADA